jgi:hypothetical protein
LLLSFRFQSDYGWAWTVGEALAKTGTDALIVVHAGRIVSEHKFKNERELSWGKCQLDKANSSGIGPFHNGARQHLEAVSDSGIHLLQSVSKSLVASIAAVILTSLYALIGFQRDKSRPCSHHSISVCEGIAPFEIQLSSLIPELLAGFQSTSSTSIHNTTTPHNSSMFGHTLHGIGAGDSVHHGQRRASSEEQQQQELMCAEPACTANRWGCGYTGATVGDLINMECAVQFSETYCEHAGAGTPMQSLCVAGGWECEEQAEDWDGKLGHLHSTSGKYENGQKKRKGKNKRRPGF